MVCRLRNKLYSLDRVKYEISCIISLSIRNWVKDIECLKVFLFVAKYVIDPQV